MVKGVSSRRSKKIREILIGWYYVELVSRIVKGLRFYPIASEQVSLCSFIGGARRHKTPGSETKDFTAHSMNCTSVFPVSQALWGQCKVTWVDATQAVSLCHS